MFEEHGLFFLSHSWNRSCYLVHQRVRSPVKPVNKRDKLESEKIRNSFNLER